MKSLVWGVAAFAIALAVATPAQVSGEILIATPSRSAVLPDDGSGQTRVALYFDVSGMTQGEGRRIDEAFLDWVVSGVPSDRLTSYRVHPILNDWTLATAAGIVAAEEAADVWEYTPMAFTANQGGFLRFELTDEVRGWSGRVANYGIVIATPDVAGSALAGQLAGATLTVRYGFSR
jgi:hypothetical protein